MKELAKRQEAFFTADQVDLIKRTIAKGATDDELKLFLYQCERTGLDPFDKQIYFQKRRNNRTGVDDMVVITGIDGYRSVADRTGKYAGSDDAVFDREKNPTKATVTVYKIVGRMRVPFTASAVWDEYYPGEHLGYMWRKMPRTMLAKCAEALALRKAFPKQLGGLYIAEEMEQANAPISADVAGGQIVEIYNDQEAQKETLRLWFSELGIAENSQRRMIAAECLGLPMDQARQHIEDRARSIHATPAKPKPTEQQRLANDLLYTAQTLQKAGVDERVCLQLAGATVWDEVFQMDTIKLKRGIELISKLKPAEEARA